MIERIDDDVATSQFNVEGAHTEITKYLASVSTNRGLMLKTFATLLFVFTIFVVFFIFCLAGAKKFKIFAVFFIFFLAGAKKIKIFAVSFIVGGWGIKPGQAWLGWLG